MLNRNSMTNRRGPRNNRGGRRPKKIEMIMIVIVAICLLVYMIGQPLYLSTVFSRFSTCFSCPCDCSSNALNGVFQALSYNTNTIGGCNKSPGMSKLQRSRFDQLSAALKINEAGALVKQQQADMTLLEAKKISSQYQKIADKCNSGMETCEKAREKAEEALEAQRILTASWQTTALERGWEEDTIMSSYV